jgi:hypothetical protein
MRAPTFRFFAHVRDSVSTFKSLFPNLLINSPTRQATTANLIRYYLCFAFFLLCCPFGYPKYFKTATAFFVSFTPGPVSLIIFDFSHTFALDIFFFLNPLDDRSVWFTRIFVFH